MDSKPYHVPVEHRSASVSDNAAHAVTAKVPQGFATTINVRLLPLREIPFTPVALGCQPRKGATRRSGEMVRLPPELIGRLKEANKKVMEFLARDPSNASNFLARPVETLKQAGVELSRAQEKALARAHLSTSAGRVVPPGVTVSALSVSVGPRKRGPSSRPAPDPDNPGDTDCGCGPKGKE